MDFNQRPQRGSPHNTHSEWSFSQELIDGQMKSNDLQNPFGSDLEVQRNSQKRTGVDKKADSFSGIHQGKNPGMGFMTVDELERDADIENILFQMGTPNQRLSTRPMDSKHDPWIKREPKGPIEYTGQNKKTRDTQPVMTKSITGYAPNQFPKAGTDAPIKINQDISYMQFNNQSPPPIIRNKVLDGLEYSNAGLEYSNAEASQNPQTGFFSSLEFILKPKPNLSPQETALEYEKYQNEYCSSPYPALNIAIVVVLDISCLVIMLSTERIERNEGKLCLISSCLKLDTELGVYTYAMAVAILFSQFTCFMGISAYKTRNLFGLGWLFAAYVLIILCSMFREIHEVSFLFAILALSIGRVTFRLYQMEGLKTIIGDKVKELDHQEAKRVVELGNDDWKLINLLWTRKVDETCQASCLWSALIDITIVCGVMLTMFLIYRIF